MVNYDLSIMLGRLVEARIVAKASPNCAIGLYGAERLLVTNGCGCLDSDCLVRIDSDPTSLERGLIGNFVSSVTPNHFHELSFSEYVLFALWSENMTRRGKYPTIGEINRYFDPGNLRHAYYISSTPGRERSERTHIFHRGCHTSKESTTRMIENLSIGRNARLIISDPNYVMASICRRVEGMGLVPIVMEALTCLAEVGYSMMGRIPLNQLDTSMRQDLRPFSHSVRRWDSR